MAATNSQVWQILNWKEGLNHQNTKIKNKKLCIWYIYIRRFKLKVHMVINIVLYWYIEALYNWDRIDIKILISHISSRHHWSTCTVNHLNEVVSLSFTLFTPSSLYTYYRLIIRTPVKFYQHVLRGGVELMGGRRVKAERTQFIVTSGNFIIRRDKFCVQ